MKAGADECANEAGEFMAERGDAVVKMFLMGEERWDTFNL